jgi:hypothetical protein
MLVMTTVVGGQWRIERERCSCNPRVLWAARSPCRAGVGANARPNRTKFVIGERRLKRPYKLFQESPPPIAPTRGNRAHAEFSDRHERQHQLEALQRVRLALRERMPIEDVGRDVGVDDNLVHSLGACSPACRRSA